MKKKIALISSTAQSEWQSCKIITPNIFNSYKKQKNVTLKHYNFNKYTDDAESLEMAKDFKKQKINIVSFIDHMPHPASILKAMDHVFGNSKTKPDIIFHVYGDFTLYSQQWIQCSDIIKKYKVKFICASDRQKMLINSFVKSPNSRVFKIPFPVDSKAFYQSDTIRSKIRKKLKIKKDTFLFIYTGRLSAQKKSIELMKNFLEVAKKSKKKAKLIMAGEFDDLGVPFIGLHPLRNHLRFYFYRFLKENDPDGEFIEYIGNVDPENLIDYYNAADCFISLSVHNDEDYGMSPIEALFCGCKCILSDWAGYASFKLESNEFCKLTSVQMQNGIIKMNNKEIQQRYLEAIDEGNNYNRKEIYKAYLEHFSIKGCLERYRSIIFDKFESFKGWDDNIYKLNASFRINPYAPFMNPKKIYTYNKIYQEIYGCYFKRS